ncbi:MAG: pyruvate formate-lyase [Ruminococcaceae bacterium]|nr:pyruvate formate-lyase [Oscillospiraceae bacterium]
MTERVQKLKDFILDRSYRATRLNEGVTVTVSGNDTYEDTLAVTRAIMAKEVPVFYDNDIFGFYTRLPTFATTVSANGERHGYRANNVTPAYDLLIDRGLTAVLEELNARKTTAVGEAHTFYNAAIETLSVMLTYCETYRAAARERGLDCLANALERVPYNTPTSFYEACLFHKILLFFLRQTNDHVTLGRFDQYMYPYYKTDVARGVSREELLETLELYFLSLNVDADTYMGVQQGDNGSSMVLGGFDTDGNYQFNELSALCMDASLELGVIDPKINLRVGKKTPDWLYEYGTKMTKKGLGFPQYCNDDVIVPALNKLGYRTEDAQNYTVAACWEPIIPGQAYDVPNITTTDLAHITADAVNGHLAECDTFEQLLTFVKEGIDRRAEELKDIRAVRFMYAPLLSLMTYGCLESGRDISRGGARYNNYGTHGAGISTAVDSLAAIKTLVFDENAVTRQELLAALDTDFEGYTALRNRLMDCPKMGNDDDVADAIAGWLLKTYADAVNGKPNAAGGVWRAGTGSAQMYIRYAKECPATADGRKAGEPYACSFSPAIAARINGPLSVIRSFTKHDLSDTINGGPLTVELHDNVFRNAEGESKVATLVKLFVLSGGHQLQLNAINRDRLIEAQQHPERHPNLVVRVWGWSGYFCELDLPFQNHIISRTEFMV